MVYWPNKKLWISINQNIINKNERNASFATGFEPVQITPNELATHIQRGHAYAPQMERGVRKAPNFMLCSVLSLDIDGDVAPAMIADNPLVREGATIIYTTYNHTDEKPRYRIVFAVDQVFEDPKAFRAANEALALRLSGDPSVVDAGRMFYGNTHAKIKVFDRGLRADVVEELVAQRYNATGFEPKSERLTTISKVRLSPDTLVRTAAGGEHFLRDLQPAALFCPYHEDQNASAFLVVNKSGQKGIHCSTCATTYWPVWEPVDQTSFVAAAKRSLEFSKKHEDKGPLEQFMVEVLEDGTFRKSDDNLNMIEGLHRARIYLLENRFLPDDLDDLPLRNFGVTYIKSPKGSGKTELLTRLLADQGKTVLLVGHRKALLRQLALRLGLNCYLDEKKGESTGWKGRYAVSLDSILRAPWSIKYDLLILDESEQVLAHLLSGTMIERRKPSMLRLQHFMQQAKHVIALDADLGWPTFRFISRAKGRDTGQIVINEFVEPKGELRLFLSKGQLVEQLLGDIRKNEKCYVTSNSKADVNGLAKTIQNEFPDAKLLAITSDNSMSDVVQALLANTKLAANYDIILTSPSVSTGVDFTFDDSEEVFHVYGIFDALILTHLECDQQLSRIRQPKSLNVFVSAARFEFETNLDVVRQDLVESRLADSCMTGFSAEGKVTFDPDDPLLDLAGSVETLRRSSVNRLLDNFIAYKEAAGWTIRRIAQDNHLMMLGLVRLVNGKKLNESEWKKAVLNAEEISTDVADEIQQELDANEPISSQKILSLTRFKIEEFYRRPICPDLIFLDYKGDMRRKVRLFETITDPGLVLRMTQTVDLDDADDPSMKLLKHRRYKALFLAKILQVARLYKDGEFDFDLAVEVATMGDFIEFVSRYKAALETAFEAPIRKDFFVKPVRSLNNFLDHAGIQVSRCSTKAPGGTKRYLYKLDAPRFEAMKQIALGRQKDGSFDLPSVISALKLSTS